MTEEQAYLLQEICNTGYGSQDLSLIEHRGSSALVVSDIPGLLRDVLNHFKDNPSAMKNIEEFGDLTFELTNGISILY